MQFFPHKYITKTKMRILIQFQTESRCCRGCDILLWAVQHSPCPVAVSPKHPCYAQIAFPLHAFRFATVFTTQVQVTGTQQKGVYLSQFSSMCSQVVTHIRSKHCQSKSVFSSLSVDKQPALTGQLSSPCKSLFWPAVLSTGSIQSVWHGGRLPQTIASASSSLNWKINTYSLQCLLTFFLENGRLGGGVGARLALRLYFIFFLFYFFF